MGGKSRGQAAILILDDDLEFAACLQKRLASEGYLVSIAGDGTAIPLRSLVEYDVIISEVLLPGRDGIRLCWTVREYSATVRILFLTTLTSVADKVRAFEAGADDYISKSCPYEILAARLRALLRRRAKPEPVSVEVGSLTVDLQAHRVWGDGGEEVPLTRKEYALFDLLRRHANQIVSRSQIAAHLWDGRPPCSRSALDAHVSALRLKLGGPSTSLIRTVHGIGYMLMPQRCPDRAAGEQAVRPLFRSPARIGEDRSSLTAGF